MSPPPWITIPDTTSTYTIYQTYTADGFYPTPLGYSALAHAINLAYLSFTPIALQLVAPQLTLSPTTTTVHLGGVQPLVLQLSATDSRMRPVPPTNISWTFSNPQVATIDPVTYTVTLLQAGQTTIRAQASSGNSASMSLTVLPAIDHVSIASATNQTGVAVGSTLPLILLATDTQGSVTTVDPSLVQWTSSNSAILKVDPASGLATGMSYGTATVTAQLPWYALSVTQNITVYETAIALYQENCQAAVAYTFDDGAPSQLALGVPLLNRFNIPATFYLIPSMTTSAAWSGWKQAAAQGYEIGNHTYDHIDLTTITDPLVLNHEINDSADYITQQIGIRPLTFACPHNVISDQARQIVLQHHIAIRIPPPPILEFDGAGFTATFANAAIDSLIAQGGRSYVMIHGIDTDGYAPLPSTELSKHLQYVSTRRNVLWVDTMLNQSRYQQEHDSATLQVAASVTSAVLTLTTPLDKSIYITPLTVNIYTRGHPVTTASAVQNGNILPVTITNTSPEHMAVDIVPGSPPVTVTWQ